jgi:macrolide-specific efflux system membrane fusion protein
MNDATTTPVRRRKSSGARKAIIAGVVVALAGGGWYGWKTYKASTNKEGEYLTAPIETGDIEDLVTSTGTLQPREFVDVGAQVSGQIQKIYVEVGDMVQQGDVLAEIDATTAEAKVDQMRAQLLSAVTGLEDSKNNLEKAKRDALRQKNLLEADATTKEAKLNADTSLLAAENRIKTQEASIKVQEASLRIEERNLGYTKIVAPQAGTVMKISVKQGQTVNASQNVPVVMQIANLNTMTVQSEVSEADVGRLYDPGNPVYFTTLRGNNRRWYGELKRIEPTPKVQNNVVLYNALFDVENESGELKVSMTAQVYFVVAEAKNVLMVPMAAIQQGQQIARELQQKEREKNGGAAAAGGPPGGRPGGAPGGAPVAAGAAAASAAPGATREGAPAAVAANTAAPGGGSAPTAAAADPGNQANRPAGQGNRQANAPGGPGARGGAGGGFNGPRPGGGQGGFNPQNMTPEMRERFARGQGGGGAGQRAGGFGQRQGGMRAAGAPNAVAAATGPRPVQRRNGMVAVQKADGTLEIRRIVYGVTNRVHGEVLEGLQEGELVVVGKQETEAAAAARSANPLQNQNQNFQQNRGGNFQGGGGNFQGGGGGGFPR